MITTMKRPALPKGLQRDIRIGRMLRATAGPAKQQQNGLLTGWAEAKAPDGKTYFYHAESGEVSWERPAAAAADKDGGKPKVPSSAVVVAAKPVIPGIPVANGVAKLPRGWRCLTGADGKRMRALIILLQQEDGRDVVDAAPSTCCGW